MMPHQAEIVHQHCPLEEWKRQHGVAVNSPPLLASLMPMKQWMDETVMLCALGSSHVLHTWRRFHSNLDELSPSMLQTHGCAVSIPDIWTLRRSPAPCLSFWLILPLSFQVTESENQMSFQPQIHHHTLRIFFSNPLFSLLSNSLASSAPSQIAAIHPILSPRRHPRSLSSHIHSFPFPDRKTSSPVDAQASVFFRTGKVSSSSSWCQNKCHLFKEAVPWSLIKMKRTYTYTCLYHHRILPITQLLNI